VQLPRTSCPGWGGIDPPPVLLVRTVAQKATNVIGDEQSRANQTDAHSCDERRDGGPNAPPIGARQTRGRARIENSGKDEVGALVPTSTTDRK
jgi:hypothetical protein